MADSTGEVAGPTATPGTSLVPVRHPAKFSEPVLDAIVDLLTPVTVAHLDKFGGAGETGRPFMILDPFGGVGKVFELEGRLVGDVECWMMELEPEWADQAVSTYSTDRVLCGDSIQGMAKLIAHEHRFDCVVTSPVYGNRMSDHHEAKDQSRRHTYRHYLGRRLTDNNAGMLQWGPKYRDFHETAWELATALVRPGGYMVLNVSDHIRKNQVQRVTTWHVKTLLRLGWTMVWARKVKTQRQRQGSNGDVRVDGEMVYLLRRPTAER